MVVHEKKNEEAHALREERRGCIGKNVEMV